MIGFENNGTMGEILLEEDDNISDDDPIDEDDESPWFSMGMTRDENFSQGNYG